MVSRINTLANASTEVIGTNITIVWDPIANTGFVNWNMQTFVYANGAVTNVAPSSAGMMTIPMSTLIPMSFTANTDVDPISNVSLYGITGAGIMVILKEAFNTLYDQTYANT